PTSWTSRSCRTSRTARSCCSMRTRTSATSRRRSSWRATLKPPPASGRTHPPTATMFTERGFPTYLVPNRDVGLMVWGEFGEGLFTYQFGGFNGVRDSGNNNNNDRDTDDGKDLHMRV